LAFSANAHIEKLFLVLAYDNTPGKQSREFMQNYTLRYAEKNIIEGRKINREATVGLFNAIEKQPIKLQERCFRAIAQYHATLSHWQLGSEILALAHIFMGMEVLTPVAKEIILNDEGLTIEALQAKLQAKDNRELEAKIREQYLFQGDNKCYKLSRDAFTGFKHGYLPFKKIYEIAAEVRDKSMIYLRTAILKYVKVAEPNTTILNSAPYDYPLGIVPVEKRLKGYLLGTADNLAAEGYEHPWFDNTFTLTDARLNAEGNLDITFDEEFKAWLGEGVLFRQSSFEIWGQRNKPKP
jgi:hypothetical protein